MTTDADTGNGFWVDSEDVEYIVTEEDNYMTTQIAGVWTVRALMRKLTKKYPPPNEIDHLTSELWIIRDHEGCPIKTYELYPIG